MRAAVAMAVCLAALFAFCAVLLYERQTQEAGFTAAQTPSGAQPEETLPPAGQGGAWATVREATNVKNGGWVAECGQWTYLLSPGKGILRVQEGSETTETLVGGVLPGSLSAGGDWIYFADEGKGGAMYRVRWDGGGLQCIVHEQNCKYIQAAGDWVYYAAAGSLDEIWRVRPDGSGGERVLETNGGVGAMCWLGGYLYFLSDETDGKLPPVLKRVSTQDGSVAVLHDATVNYAFYNDELIICAQDRLLLAKRDGTEARFLGGICASGALLYQRKLFFTDAADKDALYVIIPPNIDGEAEELEPVQLERNACGNLSEVRAGIYYTMRGADKTPELHRRLIHE